MIEASVCPELPNTRAIAKAAKIIGLLVIISSPQKARRAHHPVLRAVNQETQRCFELIKGFSRPQVLWGTHFLEALFFSPRSSASRPAFFLKGSGAFRKRVSRQSLVTREVANSNHGRANAPTG